MERVGQTYYYHTNALGSVSAITDSAGAVVERYTYTAYGQMSITDGQGNPLSSSPIGNPYGFTGRRYDEETGLWYYRNLYEYVRSNPVNLVDPLGLHEDEQGNHHPPLGTGPGMAGRPGHWHPIPGFPKPFPHYHIPENDRRWPLNPQLYQQWEVQFPVYRLGPATWAYNCGGWVFGQGECWMENRHWWPIVQMYYHRPGRPPGIPPPADAPWPLMKDENAREETRFLEENGFLAAIFKGVFLRPGNAESCLHHGSRFNYTSFFIARLNVAGRKEQNPSGVVTKPLRGFRVSVFAYPV